ncbi:Cysteine desulfurase [Melia azedarach]|uniref:Cysteine desulfurase n=1 Tax=Melia azedarach TaxID=155640 RepID=A0ACC1XSQ6_MELAZ|nr:Cysteine desulfurase [Melia azedarach]
MKLKQFMLIKDNGKDRSRIRSSSAKTCSGLSDNLYHFSESFRALDMEDSVLGSTSSADKKLSWLQSQVIGNSSEFDSPFGKRRLTYADHTASGRSLRYIEDYIINKVLPCYGNTHTCDSYVGKQTTQMVHEACRYIKKCLGGGEEDAIIFCGSGTTAAIKRLQEVMGIAVPSVLREKVIKCLRDEERWVVFVGPYEHHSNLLSWRQSLAEVVEIGLDDNGLLNIEALRLQLELYKDANRPIIGSFSACSNVTGIYSDTRAIARLLHQYGGFACFDFAASAPYVEFEMRSGEMDGYDAIFLSPHKFLGGPGSPGVLLMSKALYQLGSSPPSTCGGGTVDYVNGFNEKDTLYLEDIEEREHGGTPQIVQTIRAALAFWVKQYIGYEVIKKQEEIYVERAMERLLPNENIKVLGNTSAKRLAILSFLVYSTTNSSVEIERDKPLHGAFVATLLNDLFGIQARGGCACAGPYGHSLLGFEETESHKIRFAIQKGYAGVKPGWSRVSFPYYMSNEVFEFILAALEFLAAYGQRFLPLYDFNLKTGNWCFKKSIKELIGKENKAGTLQETKIHKNVAIKHRPKIEKFASYLENAKQIADILPKFPIQRRLPEDLDPDILHFRI